MAQRCASRWPRQRGVRARRAARRARARGPRQADVDCAAGPRELRRRGSSSSSPSRSASRARAIIPIDGETTGAARRLRPRSRVRPSASRRSRRIPQPTPRSSGSSARAIRWCASTGPIATRSAPNLSAGSSRPPSPAPSGRQSVRSAGRRSGKIVTRRLAAEYEKTGSCRTTPSRRWRRRTSRRLLDQLREGDYFALLAFIEMNHAHRDALEAIRAARARSPEGGDVRRVRPAISALHRSGAQRRSGHRRVSRDHLRRSRGPAGAGAALQLRHHQEWLQARGDFEVLASRGRRVLRVHLKDVDAGLRDLHAIVQTGLSWYNQADPSASARVFHKGRYPCV